MLKLIGITAIVLLFSACNPKQKHEHTAGEIYTCPMHTQVEQLSPGNCPICGMDLVKKSQAPAAFAGLMLNDSQVRLANVSTRVVRAQEVGQSILLNGRLAADENRTEVVSSRVSGRIDRLYVKETGRKLRGGEPFLELYSEQLLTYQNEFLLALEQAAQLGGKNTRYDQFVRSARQKLLRYGLSDTQVNELAQSRKASERITFVAPAGGVITVLSVAEGQYIDEGSPLYLLEDISSLWVEAELYPGEADFVRPDQRATIKIAGFEEKSLEVLVTFVTPEYRQNTQLTIMRAKLSNPTLAYQPGMHAQVILRHSVRKSLAIPVDAVVRDGTRSFVFVMTARNTYERRSVVTGLEDTDRVEISSGLTEGEEVVTTGAYLLNSEMTLKGMVSATDHKH